MKKVPVAAVLLVCSLAPATAHAQSTPRELAGMLAAAIAAGDGEGVRAVIHPGSAAFAGAERVAGTVRGILGRQELGASTLTEDGPVRVRVVPVEELDDYDGAARVYRLGPLAFEFSPDAAPSHFLFIDRTETSSGGPDVGISNRGIVEGIVRSGNRWFVTVSRLVR